MDIYIKLFEVLFPVFFIVGIGYFLGKKDPKINTNFITKFTANIGFPGLVFYSLTGTGLTFNEFQNFFIYGIIMILAFSLVGIIFLFFLNLFICLWKSWFWFSFINRSLCYPRTLYIKYFPCTKEI